MSERSISTSLPISELITHIKHSFRERDFNEVQKILMDRENDMKIEIENLMRDRDSAKKEVCLLEREVDLKELERLKLDEKLQKSQRKCEELEEAVTRLLEEKRVSNNREKRAEERCDKIAAENSKMAFQKSKSVFELNEKINQLKNKNLESELLVGVYQEKCKCLDIEIVKKGQEIEDLRLKQLEGDRVVKGLKGENFEANKTIDELRLKKSESDEVAEVYKSRLDNLWPRIRKIEENHADMLTVKVGDLADLVKDVRQLANSEERGNLNFPDSRGKNDSSRNVSTPNGDAEDVVRSASNSIGIRSKGVSKKGDRNLVQSRTREDDARTVKTSPCSQSGCSPPRPESNGPKEPLVSGAHANGTRLISGAGCFSKTARSSSAGGEIIQIIIDSDDEENPAQAPDISKGGMGSNVNESELNFVRSPVSSQRSKRKNRTDCVGDLYANSTTKREKNTCRGDDLADEKENEVVLKSSQDRIDCSSFRRCGEEVGPTCDSQIPLKKFNGLNDEVSTDSDESYTDSRMDDFIASLGSKNLGRKFLYEADMLRAFQQDEQLCMNAICALYRQQAVARKSKGRSNLSKIGGFSSIDSISGCALAEYLINGDEELRLRKSVSEVKKQRLDVIGQCRKLANNYVEKLFAIYCSGEDPLFCQ